MTDTLSRPKFEFDPADLWVLDREDIEALEIGSAILGTGGGGNPYIGKLRARQALDEGYTLSILPLDKVPDEACCVSLGGIGAPVVGHERLREGREGLRCVRAIEDMQGFPVDLIVCEEIGGSNAMEPLIVGGMTGLPVVDCDGMGRAFPEMQMTTYSIYGHTSTPSVMCDVHGNIVVFKHAVTEIFHERMARACVVAQGGGSDMASAPMAGAFLKKFAIPNSYTQAITLGRAVMDAQRQHRDPIAAICEREKGKHIFSGKITDLKRHLRGGFVVGEAMLAGVDNHSGEAASVMIQNENLLFTHEGEVKVSVPDLIVVLDIDSGHAITTEMLRYGQRVAILVLPCHPLLQSPAALEVVGPKAFGFPDVTYRPFAGA